MFFFFFLMNHSKIKILMEWRWQVIELVLIIYFCAIIAKWLNLFISEIFKNYSIHTILMYIMFSVLNLNVCELNIKVNSIFIL